MSENPRPTPVLPDSPVRCRYCPWVGPDVLFNVCRQCREEFYGDEGDDDWDDRDDDREDD